MTTTARLTIAGRYDQIQTLCKFVATEARAAGLDADAVFHLELCCDEASTNIIEHAYGGEGVGDINAMVETTADRFTLILHDSGQPFDPAQVTHPPQFQQGDSADDPTLSDFLDHLQVGGLGIHFMRELMDEVQYSFDEGRGNQLVLVKMIPAEQRQ